KLDLSPALDPDRLSLGHGREVDSLELDQVMRQVEGSGILHNATNLREQLQSQFYGDFKFELGKFRDIVRLTDGMEIQEAIDSSYRENGKEETALIVRSNKRANLYNQSIRERILYLENLISVGDH